MHSNEWKLHRGGSMEKVFEWMGGWKDVGGYLIWWDGGM